MPEQGSNSRKLNKLEILMLAREEIVQEYEAIHKRISDFDQEIVQYAKEIFGEKAEIMIELASEGCRELDDNSRAEAFKQVNRILFPGIESQTHEPSLETFSNPAASTNESVSATDLQSQELKKDENETTENFNDKNSSVLEEKIHKDEKILKFESRSHELKKENKSNSTDEKNIDIDLESSYLEERFAEFIPENGSAEAQRIIREAYSDFEQRFDGSRYHNNRGKQAWRKNFYRACFEYFLSKYNSYSENHCEIKLNNVSVLKDYKNNSENYSLNEEGDVLPPEEVDNYEGNMTIARDETWLNPSIKTRVEPGFSRSYYEVPENAKGRKIGFGLTGKKGLRKIFEENS